MGALGPRQGRRQWQRGRGRLRRVGAGGAPYPAAGALVDAFKGQIYRFNTVDTFNSHLCTAIFSWQYIGYRIVTQV